jgi:hypothetical protein
VKKTKRWQSELLGYSLKEFDFRFTWSFRGDGSTSVAQQLFGQPGVVEVLFEGTMFDDTTSTLQDSLLVSKFSYTIINIDR